MLKTNGNSDSVVPFFASSKTIEPLRTSPITGSMIRQSPEIALAVPTWKQGKVILTYRSHDSASLSRLTPQTGGARWPMSY